jgi:hypothetical protein
VGYLDSLYFGSAWFLGQATQVIGVAGEQDNWAGLSERYHGEERVESTPVSGQAGLPEQLASGATLWLADRDDGDVAQDAVHRGVSCSAAQDLGQCRRWGNDVRPSAVCIPRQRHGERVARRKLGQTLRVEYERPAYSSSSSLSL